MFCCSQSVVLLQLCARWHQLKSDHVQAAKSSKPNSDGCFLHKRVRPLLKALHWLPFKEKIIFKFTIFVFSFIDGTHATIPGIMSLSLHSSQTLRSISDDKTLSCASWKLNGFGYGSFSLTGLFLSRTPFLLTSDTVVLSHTWKILFFLFFF